MHSQFRCLDWYQTYIIIFQIEKRKKEKLFTHTLLIQINNTMTACDDIRKMLNIYYFVRPA